MAWEDAVPGLFAEGWLLQGEKTGSGACLVSLLYGRPLGTAEEVVERPHWARWHSLLQQGDRLPRGQSEDGAKRQHYPLQIVCISGTHRAIGVFIRI